MNTMLLEKVGAVVQEYAVAREAEKAVRREVRARRCLRKAEGEQTQACYYSGAEPCAPCLAKTEGYRRLALAKRESRYLRARVEALGLRLSEPVVVEPEEPKPLLDLMVEQ